MISANRLTKAYGDFLAIEDLSFDIEGNTVVGFLGANGAGKSTTMRILACYLPPTAGSARVAGFDCFTESMQVRQTLGYLPESVPLYTDMRVEEYLRYMAQLKDVPAKRRPLAIDRVLETCRIAPRRRKAISTLSKGFRQRVGLAATLIHDPKVLILDEPTVGLDPVEIRETRQMIRGLAEQHTVLLSTHILPEVQQICGRVIIIRGGRILANAAIDELVREQSKAFIDVTAAAPSNDALADAMRGIAGVEGVDPADDAVSNEPRCRLHIAADHDARHAISGALVERGWSCLALEPSRETLEDIYVRLTETEKVV